MKINGVYAKRGPSSVVLRTVEDGPLFMNWLFQMQKFTKNVVPASQVLILMLALCLWAI
jgi:hypothetical protein